MSASLVNCAWFRSRKKKFNLRLDRILKNTKSDWLCVHFWLLRPQAHGGLPRCSNWWERIPPQRWCDPWEPRIRPWTGRSASMPSIPRRGWQGHWFGRYAQQGRQGGTACLRSEAPASHPLCRRRWGRVHRRCGSWTEVHTCAHRIMVHTESSSKSIQLNWLTAHTRNSNAQCFWHNQTTSSVHWHIRIVS